MILKGKVTPVDSRQYHLHDGKKGAALAVRIVLRSSKNEIVEVMNDGTVKVRLAISPGGDVNKALLDYMSQVLEVPRSRLDVVAGADSHEKIISILDLDAATVHSRIVKNWS